MRHQNKFTNLSREKRRLERIFRKSHLTVHRQLFIKACSRYNSMLDSVKWDYFKAKIDKAGNHRLFKTVDRQFTSGSPVLPTIYNSLDSLSANLNDFYVQRIRKLRSELEGISNDHAIPVANDSVICFHLFSQFELSCYTGKQMIRSLSSKPCSLDPVPSHLLKNHLLLTP